MKSSSQFVSLLIAPLMLSVLTTAAFVLPAPAAHAQMSMPETGAVDVNGAKIAYRVEGSGPALLLVHGYPLSGELFAKNRAALAKNFRVVTPDLRGFGKSAAPDKTGSVQIYAKDMLAVMDQLNIKTAVIGGMSMGGPVVLEMYREAPERFTGMILIDSTTSPASPVEMGEWPGFGKLAEEQGVSAMVPGLLPNMLTGKTRQSNMELADFLGSLVKEGTVNGAVGGAQTLAERPDSRGTKINVPVLLIVGQEDPIYSVEMQMMMQSAIPGSQLTVIPGASHAAIIEKPAEANKAILDWTRKQKIDKMQDPNKMMDSKKMPLPKN